MKAIFITYNQAITPRVMAILDNQEVRGFTLFPLTHGRGSFSGEPHMGSHAWPSMNSSVLAMVEDGKVAPLLDAVRELDKTTQLQGIRAFVWEITDMM